MYNEQMYNEQMQHVQIYILQMYKKTNVKCTNTYHVQIFKSSMVQSCKCTNVEQYKCTNVTLQSSTNLHIYQSTNIKRYKHAKCKNPEFAFVAGTVYIDWAYSDFPSVLTIFKTALVSIIFILELSVLDKSCSELNFQAKDIISRVPCTPVFLRSTTSDFQY